MNSKIIISLAFVAISIGLYGVVNAPGESMPVQPEVPTKVVTYKVWQLTHPAVKGQQLKRSDFEIKHLSQAQASPLGIDQDIELNWNGPVFAVRDIAANEWVDPNMLTSPGDSQYLQAVIQPGFVPYNVTVPGKDVLGGTIAVGDLVDISVLSTPDQNLSSEDTVSDIQHLTMTPLLAQVLVLDMVSSEKAVSTLTLEKETQVTLILQVSNQQLAQLTVAQRIAEVAVHKSLGEAFSDDLEADSSDIIPISGGTSGIREYRFE
ncbi:RcpC/CpaB family pilus assembly protein [uncultured Vibrio sp.]|uniref:RcpC/CpaB family pilus assembly protein n=1 Tax=uncultured Vibrio sp. TaxID=114054 RepID=UPI000910A520|nr:RcpC/CpaB family pilus assembly protein [uncultured Vibrio sp.]OIQ25106.1 MAG: Flp pilus assembly protein CpaB [Vibrio sp. MedPE-SWchi]